jgi:hypothetical protein
MKIGYCIIYVLDFARNYKYIKDSDLLNLRDTHDFYTERYCKFSTVLDISLVEILFVKLDLKISDYWIITRRKKIVS